MNNTNQASAHSPFHHPAPFILELHAQSEFPMQDEHENGAGSWEKIAAAAAVTDGSVRRACSQKNVRARGTGAFACQPVFSQLPGRHAATGARAHTECREPRPRTSARIPVVSQENPERGGRAYPQFRSWRFVSGHGSSRAANDGTRLGFSPCVFKDRALAYPRPQGLKADWTNRGSARLKPCPDTGRFASIASATESPLTPKSTSGFRFIR